MKASIERISFGLLCSGTLMLSAAVAYGLFTACVTDASTCVAANALFSVDIGALQAVDFATAESSATEAVGQPSGFEFLAAAMKATGMYLILIAAVVLIILELIELKYLKMLFERSQTLQGRG